MAARELTGRFVDGLDWTAFGPWRPVAPCRGRWRPAGSSVADAGIDEGVAQVDQEVHADEDRRVEQPDRLHHRIVAQEQGADGRLPEARNAEDRLDHEGPGEGVAEGEARDRD